MSSGLSAAACDSARVSEALESVGTSAPESTRAHGALPSGLNQGPRSTAPTQGRLWMCSLLLDGEHHRAPFRRKEAEYR